MGYRPAGGGRGGPSTYCGDHVLTVAPAGHGAQFSRIQDAIDYADTSLPDGDPVGILISPGRYDEDVILRRDNTHLSGLTGPASTFINSVCVSDCTLASIDNFRNPSHPDRGDPKKLVEDAVRFATKAKPRTVSFMNVQFGRKTGPAWFPGSDGIFDPNAGLYNHDSALFSFSALGAPVPGNIFLSDICAFLNCVTGTAAGSVTNAPNGFYFCYAGNPVFLSSVAGDGIVNHNCGSVLLLHSTALSPLVTFYDILEAEPLGSLRQGFVLYDSMAGGGLYAIGPDAMNSMSNNSTIMKSWRTEAVNPASLSTLVNTTVYGDLRIDKLGPAVMMIMGRYYSPCDGPGSAGFYEYVGYGT